MTKLSFEFPKDVAVPIVETLSYVVGTSDARRNEP
jgi:hypothetical protein